MMLFMDIPGRTRWIKATRYYELSLQLDLWGHWCLVRAWGRARRAGGRCTSTPYPTLTDAITAYDTASRRRRQRGYDMEPRHA